MRPGGTIPLASPRATWEKAEPDSAGGTGPTLETYEGSIMPHQRLRLIVFMLALIAALLAVVVGPARLGTGTASAGSHSHGTLACGGSVGTHCY